MRWNAKFSMHTMKCNQTEHANLALSVYCSRNTMQREKQNIWLTVNIELLHATKAYCFFYLRKSCNHQTGVKKELPQLNRKEMLSSSTQQRDKARRSPVSAHAMICCGERRKLKPISQNICLRHVCEEVVKILSNNIGYCWRIGLVNSSLTLTLLFLDISMHKATTKRHIYTLWGRKQFYLTCFLLQTVK